MEGECAFPWEKDLALLLWTEESEWDWMIVYGAENIEVPANDTQSNKKGNEGAKQLKHGDLTAAG